MKYWSDLYSIYSQRICGKLELLSRKVSEEWMNETIMLILVILILGNIRLSIGPFKAES